MTKTIETHLPWLDGVRGLAALWVVLHHVYILVGATGAMVLSWGGVAVDLFMMVSSFLMAHHFIIRSDSRPWRLSSTWKEFWVRRWFRLSPLYYVLLFAALLLGGWLGDQRASLAQVWPHTATAAERYTDASPTNVLLHLTYVFGAVPAYSLRSALPDWSIGLEAQFYLAFPFIMIMLRQFGAITGGLGLLGACLCIQYLFPGFFRSFPMPSFLPIKMFVFMIGIWLAMSQTKIAIWRYLIASIAVAGLYLAFERSTEAAARLLVVAGLFALVHCRGVWHEFAVRLLSCRIARFMGSTSYAMYLLHLLILIPIAAWLAESPWFLISHWFFRFVVCAVLVVPLGYLGATVLYRFIELPGITLGKRLLSKQA